VLDADKFIRAERAKRALVTAFGAGVFVLLIASGLRFVPRFDDALSGRPEYLHAIADRMAQSLADSTNREIPVLVRQQEFDCDRTQNVPSRDTDVLYYLFIYSEKAKSLCFVTSQPLQTGVRSANQLLLSDGTDKWFGQPLKQEVAAEPIAHFSLKFPDSYLSLLHWRTPIEPARLARAGSAQLRRAIPQSMPLTDIDISLQLPELRKAVAKRHDAVNLALSCLIVSSLLTVIISVFRGWHLRREMLDECRRYGKGLHFREFLTGDLYFISAEAARTYRTLQEAAAKELRQQTLQKQSLEELQGRLRGLLAIVDSDPERQRITQVIERADIAETRHVVQDIEAQLAQTTPEERLLSLVESVEQFSTPEELTSLRAEAIGILQQSGFRVARSFVVRAHDDFRERARLRENEQNEMQPGENGSA
jgi:hypothetical protein